MSIMLGIVLIVAILCLTLIILFGIYSFKNIPEGEQDGKGNLENGKDGRKE